jgi:hypothetical protein
MKNEFIGALLFSILAGYLIAVPVWLYMNTLKEWRLLKMTDIILEGGEYALCRFCGAEYLIDHYKTGHNCKERRVFGE